MEASMKLLFLVFLLVAVSGVPAYGATPAPTSTNYDVELLVFAIQAPGFEGSELWTRAEQPLDLSNAVPPQDLPPSLDFSKLSTALAADSRYRILIAKHWVQPADTKSNVPPMLLTSGDNGLTGSLQFYLSRYPHVELNMMFQPQPAVIGDALPPDYVIREQRRVRNGELNYFDHPRFGAIVRVTPVPAKSG
jgi:hypothetical protein